MGDEKTVADAHHRISAHEAVCAERYENLLKSLNLIDTKLIDHGQRFNAISARMWSMLMAVTGAAVIGLSTVLFYLLTRGKV